jgi:Ca-activated chloride channel family protein
MDNQDKIFEKIKNASQKVEKKDFPAFEKVWMRVEEKLDKKEDKKAIALWKKIAVAASLLLFFSLGYQFLKNDAKIIVPTTAPENKVVIQEEQETKATDKPSGDIRPDAEVILKKQIVNKIVVVDEKRTTQPIISTQTGVSGIVEEDNTIYDTPNEVVVEGYSTQKRSTVMGSVSLASSGESLRRQSPNVNFNQTIQGSMAGIQVESISKNGTPQIYIRGKNSNYENSSPVVLVDGIPKMINDINIKNIASINTLKDSAATSAYGARGINGIILITTKNGVQQNLSKKELEKRFRKLDKEIKQIKKQLLQTQ